MPSNATRTGLLFCLFFLSGASGLMLEIVWIRAVGTQFGTTAPAVATVLAAFMGGLALGSLLLGPRADRHAAPLKLYAKLELGIAVSGLVVSMLLLHGDAALLLAVRAIAGAGPLATAVRFLVMFGLLLIPTTLMGGTLPVLSRSLVRSGRRGSVVGTLYTLNTAGAVAGTLLPDLLVIPNLGVTSTALIAVTGNLVVALLVNRTGIDNLGAPPVQPAASPPVPKLPLVLYAASGFCAMGYQVIWCRVLQHWTWGLIVSFSALLAVFLVFLALGSGLTSRLVDRVSRPVLWAAALVTATGAAALAPIALGDGPTFLAAWTDAPQQILRPSIWQAFPRAVLLSLYLEAPACLLMGATLPFLAAAVVVEGNTGRATGWLYASNTVAGVVGSIAAGFVLLPALGAQSGLVLLTLVAAVAGAGSLFAIRPFPWLSGAGILALGAAVLLMGLTMAPERLRDSYFRDPTYRIEGIAEGATTTAAAATKMVDGEPVFMTLLTPGVVMSGTEASAQRYMGLMGHLPMFYSKEGSEALLICYGLGVTARALLSHPELQRLDVVDISPEVLSLSGHFAVVHGSDPLSDPRVETIVDDGRRFLITTDRQYDVITLEPPPPSAAGVVNLYARDFYAAAAPRLKPGGVCAQWLPLFLMDSEATLAIVSAMVSEFDHCALVYGCRYQWLLLGSNEPLDIDLPRWSAIAEQPSTAHDLQRIGVFGLPDLVATFMLGDADLREVTRFVVPVSDDHPIIQYPRRPTRGTEVVQGLMGRPRGVPAHWAGRDQLTAERQQEIERALAAMTIVHGVMPDLDLPVSAVHELTIGNEIRRALHLQPGHPHLMLLLQLGEDQIEVARAMGRRGIVRPGARLALARDAFYRENWSGALRQLTALEDLGVDPIHVALLRGGAERAMGHPDEARKAFEEVAAGSTSDLVTARARELAASADQAIDPELGPLAVEN